MLTEEDKTRCRHHTGYLAVTDAQTFVLGVPAGVQTQFMIEGALNRILPQAEERFRKLLDRMDSIEEQIDENSENLAVESIDTIKVNLKEFQGLIRRYKWWQAGLCNMLGVIANPNDQRFASWAGGSQINARVEH